MGVNEGFLPGGTSTDLSSVSTRASFTLIEMLVVVAILGILAGLLLPLPGGRSATRFGDPVLPRVQRMARSGWAGSMTEHHQQALRTRGAEEQRIQVTVGDFQNPAGSGIWVLLHERQETIENGWFGVALHIDGGRRSWPAGHHHQAGGLHFAYAHSEIHRWLDPRTLPPVSPGASWEDNCAQPGSADTC